MKQLTCEMCGSTEMVKQDGYFVCQTCGCKYSTEEAKKMMIEGTVNVQGTVSIDNTNAYQNLLGKIEIAFEDKNIKDLIPLCDKALDFDLNNSQVWFYKGWALWDSLQPDYIDARKCFIRAIDNSDPEKKEEVISKIKTVLDDELNSYKALLGNDIFARKPTLANAVENGKELKLVEDFYSYMYIAHSKCVLTLDGEKEDGFPFCEEYLWKAADYLDQLAMNSWNKNIKPYANSAITEIQWLSCIIWYSEELITDNGPKDILRYTHKLELYNAELDYCKRTLGFHGEVKKVEERIKTYKEKILKINPNYSFSTQQATSNASPVSSSDSSGGCYVATCVYGSYDCPEVWTLRRYRDNTLGSTWYGRLFVRTYYAISPTLVKWFGNTNWFKKLWKGKLDRMVKSLQSRGVENTPYEDRPW